MPFRSNEEKLAYQRKWYAEHKERVKEWTKRRKRVDYAGFCINCGGPTTGESNIQREWCAKPECASVQRQLIARGFLPTRKESSMSQEPRWAHRTTAVKGKGRFRVFCTCGWQSGWYEDAGKAMDESRKHTGLVEKKGLRPDARG